MTRLILFHVYLFSFGAGFAAEAPPEQPKNYYVDMAALNLFTYSSIYHLEPDLSKKKGVAQHMAFISFNYFVQKETGIIPWSAKYEKAIRISYNGLKPSFDKENPYMNPCGWIEGADEPKMQFPKTHKLTLPEYQNMTERFVTFLNQEIKIEEK